jgi:electron transport complex protein RnfE
MNKATERLYNGIIKENPTFVLTLGMCPTLAVTTSAMNGLGMGLSTTFVLTLSNLLISALRKVIPNRVRIPSFIVIVASFVTILQLLLEAYLPSLNSALGVYIPLIVVNCIILGRAESFAYSNPVIPSLFDGLGMGLGFSFALTIIGAVRELVGSGKFFNITVMPASFTPISIFVLAPGAFFVLAFLTAIQNLIKEKMAAKGKDVSKIGSGCAQDCASCGDSACSKRFYDAEEKKEAPKVEKVEQPEKVEKKEEPVKTEKVEKPKKVEKTEKTEAADKVDDLDMISLDDDDDTLGSEAAKAALEIAEKEDE